MTCPICGAEGCKTYPLMVDQFRAGRRRDHWRAIHDRMNGIAPSYPPVTTPQTPPLVPLADSLRAQRYGGLKCWFAVATPGCGCSGFHCDLLRRDGVTLRDCIACLRAR